MQVLKCTRKSVDAEWVKSEALRLTELFIQTREVGSVWWFGSSAEGKMTDQSDFDFLVTCESEAAIRRGQRALRGHYPLSQYPVDIVWVTNERFTKMKSMGGVCMVAYEEGICTYRGVARE